MKKDVEESNLQHSNIKVPTHLHIVRYIVIRLICVMRLVCQERGCNLRFSLDWTLTVLIDLALHKVTTMDNQQLEKYLNNKGQSLNVHHIII